jgi:hypothetical protein
VENKSNIANFFSKPSTPLKKPPHPPSSPIQDSSHHAGADGRGAGDVEMEGVPGGAVDHDAEGDINSESRAPGKRAVEELDEIQREHDMAAIEENKSPAGQQQQQEGKGQGSVKTVQRKPTKRAKVSPSKKKTTRDATKTSSEMKITKFFTK